MTVLYDLTTFGSQYTLSILSGETCLSNIVSRLASARVEAVHHVFRCVTKKTSHTVHNAHGFVLPNTCNVVLCSALSHNKAGKIRPKEPLAT